MGATSKGIKCDICGKEIHGEYMQANIGENLKPTKAGTIVCSQDCARKFEETLAHGGKPLEHWSRITGYYQNIDGWNEGKMQELKDRRRYGV
ncbi:MAG: anaerobic ribonucleoside-triphosphate reductase [Candidatus Altiarchaeota archaeon]|nr:anaerobic ribonucleoside-triphosphate reductase [Candidatus Altiarchaeota archaeon]